jgi:hypothetical protein
MTLEGGVSAPLCYSSVLNCVGNDSYFIGTCAESGCPKSAAGPAHSKGRITRKEGRLTLYARSQLYNFQARVAIT